MIVSKYVLFYIKDSTTIGLLAEALLNGSKQMSQLREDIFIHNTEFQHINQKRHNIFSLASPGVCLSCPAAWVTQCL